MPAEAERFGSATPRERVTALAAVALVQAALGFALLIGLRVPLTRSAAVVQQLIEVVIPKAPPPPPVVHIVKAKPVQRSSSAPKAEPKPLGGSPGQRPAHAPP